MPKIKRSLFRQFINATPSASTATYEVIGKDNEELVVEMGGNVVKKKNVLGDVTGGVDSYERQLSVEPFIADSDSKLSTWLKTIIDDDKTLDDLNTDIVEVDIFATATAGAYPATKRECFVEVVSYGGNTEGFQIPFNVHYTGGKVKGSFNPTTNTFTATVNIGG